MTGGDGLWYLGDKGSKNAVGAEMWVVFFAGLIVGSLVYYCSRFVSCG